MLCPQCSIELEAIGRPRCAQCGGAFVSDAELNELFATMDARKDPADRRTTADWPIGSEPSERRCPECETEMARTRMERVHVERCAQHGVWFDRDELQRVLTPNVDEIDVDAPHAARQQAADSFELGTLGTVVRLVYTQIRRP